MDFDFSPEEDVFRAKVRDFLDAALPSDYDPAEHGYGRNPEFQKKWNEALGEAGWLGYAWRTTRCCARCLRIRLAIVRWRTSGSCSKHSEMPPSYSSTTSSCFS